MSPYRVVQWATGNIGTYALRSVIEHPDMTLAGVYVHTSAKAGKDAGELCGLPPTGVVATHDIDEILALGADCVLYMPAACDIDKVCRLLASGANVVTTRGEFHRGDSIDPVVRKLVEAACDGGGTSIHSTGSSPGFITEAIPLVLTSIQRRFDGLAISEYADLSQRNSPDLLFNVMGFGKPVAEFDTRRFSYGRISFGPSLQLLADALGMPLDSVEASGDVATARHQVRIAAGTLEAGTVAAQRMMVSGIREGRPVLRFCPGRGRRAARHRHPLSGAARPDGSRLPRLHGQPRGQRRAVRLLGRPGNPFDGRPSPDRGQAWISALSAAARAAGMGRGSANSPRLGTQTP